jgi:hypothetical protein
MPANFTANGTRWRVQGVSGESAEGEQLPPLPGPGLLFTSADAETRFLSLAPDVVPTEDYLREKTVAELAAMVKLARPLDR